ncbi:MAG TPA: hypothetical protein VGX23_23030 [Actinocrinis sp.]|nr:hypothetical protein [Actinocrinis sp.]
MGKTATPVFDPSDDTDLVILETTRDALSNMVGVLSLIEAGQVRCSATTARPSAASVRLVEDALVVGDYYDEQGVETFGPIAAFAWPLLVQAGGLARLVGTKLELTAAGKRALTAPGYAALARLWGRWMAKAPIDEFSRIDAIKGQRTTGTLTAPARRRAALAEALVSLPAGRWIRVDELFGVLSRLGDLKVTRGERARWRLYLLDAEYGSLGWAGFGDFPIVEGRYVLCLLLEYAATLGIVDVAYRDPSGARDDFRGNWGADEFEYLSRYDGLAAIRITPLGAAALRGDPIPDLGLPVPASDLVNPAQAARPRAKTGPKQSGRRTGAALPPAPASAGGLSAEPQLTGHAGYSALAMVQALADPDALWCRRLRRASLTMSFGHRTGFAGQPCGSRAWPRGRVQSRPAAGGDGPDGRRLADPADRTSPARRLHSVPATDLAICDSFGPTPAVQP